ncbi:hypothetical protein M747DRAFT_38191 [Aspergillus niger ATCC 13496]|uniref:Uncharacterized protein n=1 Tax=Aspergillus niger ATCC 13496 TaxID=1353008 RepID=A0A370BYF6_ASPNG|nr:hypothetical protein M747DRAFT_38191 [Aspergillus niger ATCC 13496]
MHVLFFFFLWPVLLGSLSAVSYLPTYRLSLSYGGALHLSAFERIIPHAFYLFPGI